MSRFREWTAGVINRGVSSPHAERFLFWLAFIESSFFPIPPDLALIPMSAKNASRYLWQAFITTIGSVLGGLLGYAIGYFFFDKFGQPLLDFYQLTDAFQTVQILFSENAFWAIFVAAFTPIPYKVFTIAGGLFSVPLLTFTIASIIGRGLRFFIVAILMKFFGEKLSKLAYRYFNLLTGVLALLAIFLAIWKFW